MDEDREWSDFLKRLDRELVTILEQLEQADLARAKLEIEALCERVTHVGTTIGGERGKLLSAAWTAGVVVSGAFDTLAAKGILKQPEAGDLHSVFRELVRFLRDGTTAHKQTVMAADTVGAINSYLSERGFAVGGGSRVSGNLSTPTLKGEKSEALARLLRLYTGKIGDEGIQRGADVLVSEGTVDDKLRALDKALRIPANASAQDLADVLGVSKQAVAQSPWWTENRRGAQEEIVEGRRERLKDKGRRIERAGDD